MRLPADGEAEIVTNGIGRYRIRVARVTRSFFGRRRVNWRWVGFWEHSSTPTLDPRGFSYGCWTVAEFGAYGDAEAVYRLYQRKHEWRPVEPNPRQYAQGDPDHLYDVTRSPI